MDAEPRQQKYKASAQYQTEVRAHRLRQKRDKHHQHNPLAKNAKQVYGVEIVPQAIEDAKQNAIRNNITNAEFFVGAAEEVLPEKYRESNGSMRADVIVVDPPRKGCDEALLQTVVNMEPKRVVYVSCDPATLARDVKFLEENGYKDRKSVV